MEPAVIDQMLKREPGASGMLGYGDLATTLNVIIRAIGDGPYLMGKQFTAADVVIGSGLRWGMAVNVIPDRPEFLAYDQRMGERSALRRVLEKNADLVR